MSQSAECLDTIFGQAPGFVSRRKAMLEGYGPEEPGPYIYLGEFASYLVELYVAGDTACFTAVFTTVERLAERQDSEILSLLAVGLFEDIQNICSNNGINHHVFLTWLGPKSRELWEEVDLFWKRLAAAQAQEQGDRRPSRDVTSMLDEVTNPQLRKMIERMYRREG